MNDKLTNLTLKNKVKSFEVVKHEGGDKVYCINELNELWVHDNLGWKELTPISYEGAKRNAVEFIDSLDVSVRAKKICISNNIQSWADLEEILEVKHLRGFGRKTKQELKEMLWFHKNREDLVKKHGDGGAL